MQMIQITNAECTSVETVQITNELHIWQHIVGGYIDVKTLNISNTLTCHIIYNEEGSRSGLKETLVFNNQTLYGNILIAKADAVGEVTSLSTQEIEQVQKVLGTLWINPTTSNVIFGTLYGK